MLEYFVTDILKIEDIQSRQTITSCLHIKSFSKNDILLQEGRPIADILFLLDGIIRGYYYDESGKEYTDCIADKPFIPLLSINGLEEKSSLSFQAITDGQVFTISHTLSKKLLRDIPEVRRFYLQCLDDSLKLHSNIKRMLYSNTTKERYLWFLKTYPNLIDTMKHRHIASFLGMTPVSLSRIRSQIKKQQSK